MEIKKPATSMFWEHRWKKFNLKKLHNNSKGAEFYVKLTKKFVPKNKLIIEGGCGLGHIVAALKRANYKVIGFDFSKTTIKKILEANPNLDVRYGNVKKLPLPDKSVGGYWSLGVIEHFYNGINSAIKEINRVVEDNGFIFISFPSICPFRKIKIKFKLYKITETKNKPKNFYQYFFNKKTICDKFLNLGYKLVYKKNVNAVDFLKSEISNEKIKFFKKFIKVPFLKKIIIKTANLILPFCGLYHSTLLIFKKHKI